MTKKDKEITKAFIDMIKRNGWKPMDTKDGCAWFGGKSHHTLSEYLTDDAFEHNHEDIDFLVVGWRT